MGKLAERKPALAKKVLDTEDESLLDPMDALMNGKAFHLSKAELDELDAIMERHRSGDGRSHSWSTVKIRLQKVAKMPRKA